MSSNDTPQEVIDLLNKVDKGVIGIDKPNINHTKEPSDWAPYWELEIEDGDHLRIDEQGME